MSNFLDDREHARREAERAFTQANTRPIPDQINAAPPRPRTTTGTPRRTTTHERHATAIAQDADWIRTHWPDFETALAAVHAPTLRAAASRDGGRSADHPDPTAGLVLEHADTGDRHRQTYTDVVDAIAAWRTQGAWIIQQMQTVIVAHGTAARDRARLRCTGTIDPLCQNYQAPDRNGLCDACYMTDYRTRRNTADTHHQQVCTPETSDRGKTTTLGERRPAETVGECGRCGWKCNGTDTEHVRQQLAQHHNEAHEATACPSDAASTAEP